MKNYMNKQKTFKDTDITKIQLLKAVSELLLSPDNNNLSGAIKYLAILAKTFRIELRQIKLDTKTDINKALLYKLSEIIQNKHGYIELLPETFELIKQFAKKYNLKLNI